MNSLGSDTPLSQLSIGSYTNDQLLLGDYHPHQYDSDVGGGVDTHTVSSYLPLQPSATDIHSLQSENKLLNIRLQDLQNELIEEQNTVALLRKKLNASEKEKLGKIASTNDEVSHLTSESMKYRAQLERSEAARQTLEFELITARKELQQTQHTAVERETLLKNNNHKLRDTIEDLTRQLSVAQHEINEGKDTAKQEMRLMNVAMEEKEQMISVQQKERESLQAEREKYNMIATQQEKMVLSLKDRIKDLEVNNSNTSESMKQQVLQNSLLLEKETRLKKDLDIALEKLKELESNLESERAAHLESKFNAEIVQIRLKELESVLVTEKTTKDDALTATGKLQEQLREVQASFEEELKNSQISREKLEQDLIFKCVLPATRAEKEYALLSKQLQNSLDEKKKIIRQLSSQIEIHQTNFDELKEELSQTKQKQLVLEGSYEASMKELELLTEGYSIEQPATQSFKKKTTTKKPPAAQSKPQDSTLNLSPALEKLRKMLLIYRKKLDSTSKELLSVKVLHEKASKECEQLREAVHKKDKTIETTQQCTSRNNRDIKRMKQETQSLAQQLKEAQRELNATQQALHDERQNHNQANHQLIQLASKSSADEKTYTELVHSIYKQLVSGLPSIPSVDEQLSTFSMSELSILITEQLSILINTCQRAEEKIKLLEGLLKTRDDSYEQLQRLHEEQLNKLSAATQGQTQSWQQQKLQLEEHYSHLLSEIHARHKKTQALADQAWEKVRAAGTLQHGLEEECTSLQRKVTKLETENRSLLSACALLSGTLYPLAGRVNALSAQRQLLGEKLISTEMFRSQVQLILQALIVDPHKSTQEVDDLRRQRAPLLVFRTSAIAVLAANRLIHLRRCKSAMFICQDAIPAMYSMLTVCGGIQDQHLEFAGAAENVSELPSNYVSDNEVYAWVTSQKLANTVATAMNELNVTIQSCVNSDPNKMSVTRSARTSLELLLSHLPSDYSLVQVSGLHSGFSDRGSLVWRLHRGLIRALQHQSSLGKNIPLSSQEVLTGLQKHIMEFTHHLHDSEVERKELRQEVNRLKKAKQHSIGHLKQEYKALKSQTSDMVSREQHVEVCDELKEALTREEQAQQLLDEQNARLNELSEQLNSHLTTTNDKEQTIAEAIQGLDAAKQELQYQEQQVRSVSKQRDQLEHEKSRIQEKVRDAENALKTAAKDREHLSVYLSNVSLALEKITEQWPVLMSRGPVDLSCLLSSDLIPTRSSAHSSSSRSAALRITPEITSCQQLIQTFVDAQRVFNSRLTSLNDEISQYKQHIKELKAELSDACQRQYTADGVDTNIDALAKEMQDFEDPENDKPLNLQIMEGFAPLLEDTTESLSNSPIKPYHSLKSHPPLPSVNRKGPKR